jgi:hypothetical protein
MKRRPIQFIIIVRADVPTIDRLEVATTETSSMSLAIAPADSDSVVSFNIFQLLASNISNPT